MKLKNYSVMRATANIILDKRRVKKMTGTYPVRLRVTFQRSSLNYQTIFDLSKEEYDKLSSPRINEKLRQIREKLKSLQRACDEFISQMASFNFYKFERDFVISHELFKPRKKLRETDTACEALNNFDYSIYFRQFPIFQEDHSRLGTISIVYFSYIKMLL